MTRFTAPFGMLLVALSLFGCGGENGLVARGSVEVDVGTHTTGFPFPNETRLDEAEASALGRFTGTCEMRQMLGDGGEPAWGVVVQIQRGGTVDDNGLSSITIMQRTDALLEAGRVEAEIGTTAYTSLDDGSCSIDIRYAAEDSGMVGLAGACSIEDAEGNAASVNLELDLEGCAVAR